MKKNALYIGIAVLIGLLGGWLIFGDSTTDRPGLKEPSDITDSHQNGDHGDQTWTCSMHPQIMQPEPGNCPICGMELIPVASGGDGQVLNGVKMTKNAMELANIQTTAVGIETGGGNNLISLSGKIMENEEATSVQASYFDGRIEDLNVNYDGREVRKGELLATFYAPDLIAAQQELITAASLKGSQPALYTAVRNKLKLWKLSNTQINSIEESGKVLENFPVYATVSGTVAEVVAREGDYLKQGDPILKVNNLNSVWAEFDAYETQISMIEKGQSILITTNAYPNREFDARVTFINPILNTATRTVAVRATLENNNGLFKPGMFVKGKLRVSGLAVQQQLSVPASAVMWTGERSVVYIKASPDEPVFQMREVTIGQRMGDFYTIVEGLEPGDEIVTNGTFTIDAAAQLQGRKSMMNREGGPVITGHESHGNTFDGNPGANAGQAESTLAPGFQAELMNALTSYFKLKDALADDLPDRAKNEAAKTAGAFRALPASTLGQEEKHLVTQSTELLSAIAGNSDIKMQRNHFISLNESILPLVKRFRSLDSPIYVQHCPMANSNKGALWLSLERAIRNPYFGEAMLNCGSVTDSIR